MVLSRICALILLIIYVSASYVSAAAKEVMPQNMSQKLGYALGLDIGSSLKNMSSDFDIEMLVRGIRDVYIGNKILLSPFEANRIKKQFSIAEHKKKEEERKKRDLRNMQQNLTFLDRNKHKKGVYTTVSGLQYEILREGKRRMPQKTVSVTVRYREYLIDGDLVDIKSKPVTININKQIPGLKEGLRLMTIGGKYRFFIHPRLAYGGLGHGSHIKPFDVVIYEVELLKDK